MAYLRVRVCVGVCVRMCVRTHLLKWKINKIVMQMMNPLHSLAEYAMRMQRRQHKRPPGYASVYQVIVSCISIVLSSSHGALQVIAVCYITGEKSKMWLHVSCQ